MSGSTVVTGAGIFISGEICALLHKVLEPAIRERRQRDGGGAVLRPEIDALLSDMRLAAMDYYTSQHQYVIGRIGPTSVAGTDIAASSKSWFSASELADVLHVTPRHVRRLAARHNIARTNSKPMRFDRAAVAELLEIQSQRAS